MQRREVHPKNKVYVPLSEIECHCGLQFVDQDALAVHVNADKGGVWKCSQSGCTKIYKTASSVRTHYRTRHSKEFRHYCDMCSFGHDETAAIKKHKHVRHRIVSDIMCDNCGKVFSQKKQAEKTFRVVWCLGKPFNCPEDGCTSVFRSKKTLERHKTTRHSAQGVVKEFVCSVGDCAAEYSYKDGLKQHMQAKHPGK